MNVSADTFDKLVTRFFRPLSERHGFDLRFLREGIYEIAGQMFKVRVRRGTGHSKDFLVTLSPKHAEKQLDDLSDEIGLSVLADYAGQPLRAHPLDSVHDWELALHEAADVTEKLCFPYLLGEKSDLDRVRGFIEEKINASGIRAKKYRFPRNVREEWK